jgi:two-component sensor histidine kinase/ligand-binding sensor domain-containing protein
MSTLRTLILILFTICLAIRAFSLDPSRRPQQYQLDHWDAKHGLPDNSIGALLQSRDGHIWVGTVRGVTRFDGARFRPIESFVTRVPRSRNVTGLAEGPDGSLWIATDGAGVVRYKDDSLQVFDPRHGFPGATVLCVAIDHEGSVYAALTDGGVAVISPPYTSSTITHIDELQKNSIRDISVDRHGTVWAVGLQGGLMKITAKEGGFSVKCAGLENEVMYTVIANRGDTLIISSANQVIGYAGGRSWLLVPPTPASEDFYVTLCRDRDGNIWAGSYLSGLVRLKNGDAPTNSATMTSKDGLSANYIGCLLEDREGSIWVGTEVGLDRLSDAAVQTLGEREGISSESVTSVVEDHAGDVWAGTEGGGVFRIRDGRVIQQLDSRHGMPDGIVKALGFTAAGDLMIATSSNGAYVYRNGTFRQHPPGSAFKSVSTIMQASDGTVWIGARRGVRRFTEDGFALGDTTIDSLSRHPLVMLEDRHHTIWVGTEYGLLKYSGGAITKITSADGLPEDFVTALHEDSAGNLWVGTSLGLVRFKDNSIQVFQPAQGLVDGYITCILEDSLGFVWLGSPMGVMRIPYEDFDKVARGDRRWLRVLLLGLSDGMRSSECSLVGFPSGIRRMNGEIWMTTSRGIAVIDPGNLHLEKPAFPVIIEDALSGQRRKFSHGVVDLPAGDNNLTINFSLPVFRTARRPQFHYQLEGFETEWTDAGTRQSAFYTNLPPGSYVFRVMAMSGDSASSGISSMPITVAPRFYQRRSFLLAAVIAALVLLACGHLIRTRHMQKQQKVLEGLVEERTSSLRKEIAERSRAESALRESEAELKIFLNEKESLLKEVHHRVKNNLNIVTSLLSLQAANLEDRRLQQVLLDAESRVRSLASIHELLYRSNNLAAIDFGPYIEDLVSRLVKAYALPNVTYELDIRNVYLEVGKAIPCALIVNELVTNSLKYAFPDGRKGKIDVRAYMSGQTEYCLEVADDGAGLTHTVDMSSASTLGLSLVSILSAQIGGKADLLSEGGVKCTIRFPAESEE